MYRGCGARDPKTYSPSKESPSSSTPRLFYPLYPLPSASTSTLAGDAYANFSYGTLFVCSPVAADAGIIYLFYYLYPFNFYIFYLPLF